LDYTWNNTRVISRMTAWRLSIAPILDFIFPWYPLYTDHNMYDKICVCIKPWWPYYNADITNIVKVFILIYRVTGRAHTEHGRAFKPIMVSGYNNTIYCNTHNITICACSSATCCLHFVYEWVEFARNTFEFWKKFWFNSTT